MKLHRNVRGTTTSRQFLVDRVLREGWTYAAAGEAAGVSRCTVCKWVLREWAYVRPYATSSERRQALRPRVRDHNRERPHASLGHQPPVTRLRSAA